MKKLRVNYQKTWDNEGTVYSQNVYINKDIVDHFNDDIKALTSLGCELGFLKPLSNERVQYLTLDQARHLRALLWQLGYDTKRYLILRNTRVILQDVAPSRKIDTLERVRKILQDYIYDDGNGISFHLDDYDADRQSDYEFIKKFIGW